MAQENVERFRQIAAAWNRRDPEAWLGFLHPEIEWRPGATRVEGGVFHGHEGARRFWADTYATFDQLVTEYEEVRDAGDMVVALGRLRGQSKEGVPIDTQYGVVARYRDGLVVAASDWYSHAEALEAAGLSE